MSWHRRLIRFGRWGVGVVAMAIVLGVGVLIGTSLTPSGGGGSASAAPPPLADGPAADDSLLSSGPMWYPWAPGPGELGANPQAFSVDHVVDGRTVKKVVASWNRNEDSPTAPLRNTRAIAQDNGQVFVPYDALPPEFTMVATARMRDGSVLSASFVPVPSPAPNRVGIPMARSTDVAASWETWTAPLIEDKWKLNWYRVHRDIVELADGTILLGGYGQGTIGGVTKEYSLIFESTDGGRSFRQRSAVNAGTSRSTNELGFGRTSDGRLIAMMRGTEPAPRPPAQPLTQAFSDDDGLTWNSHATFVPPEGFPNNGIMPEFVLQPNGQLLMTYGRPDNNVVVSRDGTGRTWDAGNTIYSRHPGTDPIRRWMGSSGNMDLVALNSSASLAFGDTCHNIWLCREYGHDNKVWTARVDALGPGAGRLDLAGKVLGGTVRLTGEVVAADERFAEQRLEGAVDGSSEYRSAARFAGDDQTLIVELDQVYPLERIGLMMDTGALNSANIQVSVDGQRWGSPVVQTGARIDYAMQYTDVEEPVEAKFVKISAGDDAPLSAVTELELYVRDVLTFENEIFNGTPRTVQDSRYAFVADANPGVPDYRNSDAHLVLVDADQGARAGATFPARQPAETQHVAFGFEGYGYATGPVWDVLGTNDDGEQVTAYRLNLTPTWATNTFTLRAWDGAAWQTIGSAPIVANKLWMDIAIDSTDEGTTVSVNGATAGSTSTPLAEVEEFTGLRAETGTDPLDTGNMEHAYDDVVVTPLER